MALFNPSIWKYIDGIIAILIASEFSFLVDCGVVLLYIDLRFLYLLVLCTYHNFNTEARVTLMKFNNTL